MTDLFTRTPRPDLTNPHAHARHVLQLERSGVDEIGAVWIIVRIAAGLVVWWTLTRWVAWLGMVG